MNDTQRLEGSRNIGAAIPQNAKKGVCLVRCSNVPSKAFELLIRFVGDRAIIGAKRVVNVNFNAPVDQTNGDTLSGKVEVINGVNFDCPHCINDGIISMCVSCKQWHCDTGDDTKDRYCPTCLTKQGPKELVDYINAGSKPTQQTALPRSPDLPRISKRR